MSCSTGWLSTRDGDTEPPKPSAVENKKRPAKGGIKSLRPTGGIKHRKEDRRDIAKSLLHSCMRLRDKIRNQMVTSSVRQPDTLVKDRQLRPHQLIGLEWCLALWLSGANGILAGKEFDLVACVRCSPCFASVHWCTDDMGLVSGCWVWVCGFFSRSGWPGRAVTPFSPTRTDFPVQGKTIQVIAFLVS